jgi:hypothetical protein
MDLAPCSTIRGPGCQGFAGPLPSAFLDKQIKELLQIYDEQEFLKNIFPETREQAGPYIVIIFSDSILT